MEKKRKLLTVLQGMIVGGTMLVPGASGGSMAMILGIYDRLFFSQVNPTQNALAAEGISFTNYYAFGAHRWHVWRELYIDMCTRVLWK